ncbi:Major Facilitator Superfamily protein [Sphingomonas sp. YR710]|uniref:MFS transporter n=1 Tax=Sphingomonas sp. YR710 TaxID=1882773 RepID=UPI000885B1E9|nr:MFS transporter [Sphingomonas sp. YR710]SDC04578.1 Major Facilitator Superfamily protein [Sphingomonas sp. YR710]
MADLAILPASFAEPHAIMVPGEPLRGMKAAALVASLTLAVLSYQLNATMITPVLPALAAELGESIDRISWVSSLFFLAGGIAGVVLSRWSDFIGRRRCLIMVLVLLACGTLLCIVATNLPVLLVGRVLQGCTSAAFQLAYILLREALRKEAFGPTLGLLTAICGGAAGIDGYIGGLLAQNFGVRSVFVAVLLVGLVALPATLLVVPRDRPWSDSGRMDWPGAATLSIGLISTSFFVTQGAAAGWASIGALGWLGGAAIAILAFWRVEARGETPLIATRHLRSRQIWPVLATTLLTLAGIFPVINFTIVLLSQDVRAGFGYDSATAALIFLSPAAFVGVLAAPFAGWLGGHAGWIRILRYGLIASLALLVTIATQMAHPLIVMMAIAALGLTYNGLALTMLNGLGVLLSPEDAPAALPGLNGAAFGIGVNLGIAVVAPFCALATGGGYRTALWIACGLTVLALASSLCMKPLAGDDI